MIALTVTVITTTVLCLVFPDTRWIGVAGAAILSYLHPSLLVVVATTVVLIAATAFFLTKGDVYHA